MTVSAALWEVVGGARNGGIVVRAEKDRSSAECQSRLMAGALVRVLQYDLAMGRMHYELVSGSGPRVGWVTTKIQGKELVRPWQGPLSASGDKPAFHVKPAVQDVSLVRKEHPTARARRRQDRNPAEVGGLGVISYAELRPGVRLGSLNAKVVAKPKHKDTYCQPHVASEMLVCPQCSLPIGDFAYRCDDSKDGALLHGECQAQLLLQQANKEERARQRRDAELKRCRRAEYDIGWKVERVPRNMVSAEKLGFEPAPNGMYALTFLEDSNTARVVPTDDPMAALNLEYLALALQVRMREGREALFSLDPKNMEDRAKALWQVKRFEPAWLSGTSFGDAMFQADVHLKELSMGEYAQPVIGMRSCFDMHVDENEEAEWNAREWFVVRRAEIELSHEKALVPRVSMGVEAREQIVGKQGLEDAVLSSPDHPLVKYAQAFEHNFDLIAERKSVVFHLREVCKASVLAKFIVDNNVNVEDPWHSMECPTPGSGSLEIPQLWNERFCSQISLRAGEIVDAGSGIVGTKRGLYGGVELQVPTVRRGPPLTMAKGQLSRASTASGLLASGQEGFAYTPMPGARAPRGVDLNLDSFDVSVMRPDETRKRSFASGTAFFKCLDTDDSRMSLEDKVLLKCVFNPLLSDRRMEGERFTPPESSTVYLDKLQALVEEERAAFQSRKDGFISATFQRNCPGELFPAAWAPSHTLAREKAKSRELTVREGYGSRMERMLVLWAPVFDKSLEDGTRFRIYEMGSLEVRTIQEQNGKEEIVVVFSTRPPRDSGDQTGDSVAKPGDTIVRATQFVEASSHGKEVASTSRFYVVFETLAGDFVATEKLGSYTAWVKNPSDLETRNSCAKVTRTMECSDMNINVLEVKQFKDEVSRRASTSPSGCAQYAEEIYTLILPARQRSWATLLDKERETVESFGLQALWGEEPNSTSSSVVAWEDLDEQQCQSAQLLGFDEASWGRTVCWVPTSLAWSLLTEAQRSAATSLGVTSASSWDGASWLKLQSLGGSWERVWKDLTDAEREAAKVLGVSGCGAWDTCRRSLSGAWKRACEDLTPAEREAAQQLGAADCEAWDRRTARVWRKGWRDLSVDERTAAGRLGFDRDCWARFA